MSTGRSLLGGLLSNYTYGILGMDDEGLRVNPLNAVNAAIGDGASGEDADGAEKPGPPSLAPQEIKAMEERKIISPETSAMLQQQPMIPMRRNPPPQMVAPPQMMTQAPPPMDLGRSIGGTSPMMPQPMPQPVSRGPNALAQARGIASGVVDDPLAILLGNQQ